MKTLLMSFAVALSTLCSSALAAPIGWYDFSATWRDGQFEGKFYYDSASPYRVTAVDGTLVDLARTTAIDQVWRSEEEQPASWVFLSNRNPAEPAGHDAGFYLTLVDLGSTLALDLGGENGLYDWSNEALYNPDQLDNSPLLSYSIAQAAEVPEPATALLLLGGLAGLAGVGRQRRAGAPRA